MVTQQAEQSEAVNSALLSRARHVGSPRGILRQPWDGITEAVSTEAVTVGQGVLQGLTHCLGTQPPHGRLCQGPAGPSGSRNRSLIPAAQPESRLTRFCVFSLSPTPPQSWVGTPSSTAK